MVQLLSEKEAKGEIKDKVQKEAKAVKSRLKTLSDMRMLMGILLDEAESKSFWINRHWEESQ